MVRSIAERETNTFKETNVVSFLRNFNLLKKNIAKKNKEKVQFISKPILISTAR